MTANSGVMTRKSLFLLTAVCEGGTGIALLLVPRVVGLALLGVDSPSPEVVIVSRVAGAALVAIAIACWFAEYGDRKVPQFGLLLGVAFYDLAAAGLLASAALVQKMTGFALWPAVIVHIAFALWAGMCCRK